MQASKTNMDLPEGFRAVTYMREVRDRISKDIQDMSFGELMDYFKKRRMAAAKGNSH